MAATALTARQLRFAEELAKGSTQARAYELAGYATHDPKTTGANAARLAVNDRVKHRVAEIRAQLTKKTLVTVETLTNDLTRIASLAEKDGQYAAATGALALIARLHGLITDRREVDITHHKPARDAIVKDLELTEDEWVRLYRRDQ